MRKRFLSIALLIVCMMSLTLTGCQPKDDFSFEYWNEDSAALAELQEFVEDVTDENSENFVPVEDRMAVFDMDGTLYTETAPIYLERLLYIHRVLEDDGYKATADQIKYAKDIQAYIDGKGTYDEDVFLPYYDKVFEGMTMEEFDKYAKDYINNTEAEGCDGRTYAEVFFEPMVEVVDYLNANDFTVYVCSGSDRATCRALLDGHVAINDNNMIGSDAAYVPNTYKGSIEEGYEYTYEDKMIRSGMSISDCWRGEKSDRIAIELGKQPILVFGNSLGDSSMAIYATDENPYKSAVFMVKADDESKVHTDLEEYEKRADFWEQNNWVVISMKNDFKALFKEKAE